MFGNSCGELNKQYSNWHGVCTAIICYKLLDNDILIDRQYSNSLILDTGDILLDRQYSNSLILDSSDILIGRQNSNILILMQNKTIAFLAIFMQKFLYDISLCCCYAKYVK